MHSHGSQSAWRMREEQLPAWRAEAAPSRGAEQRRHRQLLNPGPGALGKPPGAFPKLLLCRAPGTFITTLIRGGC